MQDCYFRADLEGNVQYLSPSVKNFFKFEGPIEELYGRSLLEVFDNPEDREQAVRLREKFGKITDYEINMHRYDGTHLVASINSSYWYDKDDNICGIEGSLRDITQRKEMELELVRLTDDLEGKVIDQTKSLINAKERAEEANKAKSIFLTNITHELMTPLHGILSFAELGFNNHENLSPEKIGKYFDVINDSGNKLLILLKNLLDFSRMNSGQMQYIFVDVCVIDIIKISVDSAAAKLKQKEMNLSIDKQSVNIDVHVDIEKIVLVMCNIIENSIKFSPNHSSINIFVKEVSGQIEVLIRDEGIGVPVDELDEIFINFSQRSNCKKMVASGAGFGLAICKEIIEAHKGTINAMIPDNGIGLSIVVRLPQSDTGKDQVS